MWKQYFRLNLKPDNEILPYNMPEIFNKSEHGLTNIIIAWDEFNPVFHPDDEFLPYNMPEIFNKSGHGLTNIIIAWDEFNPVFHPQFFWE